MAQNENQVDVSITLGADISGGVQTEKELERIRSKAKETERTAKNVDGFKICAKVLKTSDFATLSILNASA